MNFYTIIRKVLFCLEPELAHKLSLTTLKYLLRGPLAHILFSHFPWAPVTVMGLKFPNPVGVAAGLDQHGNYMEALSALGFGFIEIGGITPRAQLGNPKPRLFRLPEVQGLINRKGFPNQGIDAAIPNLQHRSCPSIIGINIAKNADTPMKKAVDDYITCFEKAVPYADYITLNVSSPNTQGLRTLQNPDQLSSILKPLKDLQHEYHHTQKKYCPMVVKISPDLNSEEIKEIAECLLSHQVDGVIATNTTLSRPIPPSKSLQEAGGLSGRPLRNLSTTAIHTLKKYVGKKIPLIGCGGILEAKDALEKFNAGASLVQLYTGLIYQGPALVRNIMNEFQTQKCK